MKTEEITIKTTQFGLSNTPAASLSGIGNLTMGHIFSLEGGKKLICSIANLFLQKISSMVALTCRISHGFCFTGAALASLPLDYAKFTVRKIKNFINEISSVFRKESLSAIKLKEVLKLPCTISNNFVSNLKNAVPPKILPFNASFEETFVSIFFISAVGLLVMLAIFLFSGVIIAPTAVLSPALALSVIGVTLFCLPTVGPVLISGSLTGFFALHSVITDFCLPQEILKLKKNPSLREVVIYIDEKMSYNPTVGFKDVSEKEKLLTHIDIVTKAIADNIKLTAKWKKFLQMGWSFFYNEKS